MRQGVTRHQISVSAPNLHRRVRDYLGEGPSGCPCPATEASFAAIAFDGEFVLDAHGTSVVFQGQEFKLESAGALRVFVDDGGRYLFRVDTEPQQMLGANGFTSDDHEVVVFESSVRAMKLQESFGTRRSRASRPL